MNFANEESVLRTAAKQRAANMAWVAIGAVLLGAFIAIGRDLSPNLALLSLSVFVMWSLLGFAVSDYYGSKKPGHSDAGN